MFSCEKTEREISSKSPNFQQIKQALALLNKKNKISNHNGFWYLTDCQQNSFKSNQQKKYKSQIQKNKISVLKIKKINRWIKTIKWLPYLREVFLTGTLAMKRGDTKSDWDVLVVTAQNRIWLGRLFLTIWLQLIGKRRSDNKVTDRFCLNQFITEGSLCFQERNEFSANEIMFARALFDNSTVQVNFLQANVHWIKKLKPNFHPHNIISSYKTTQTSIFLRIKLLLETILEQLRFAEKLNQVIKKIMIAYIVRNPKTYTERADVRYSDFFLVFLPYPQRQVIRQKTYQAIRALSKKN